MIDVMFKYGTEIILVRIRDGKVFFATSTYGGSLTTIEGLKLSHSGVIKEFPDLIGNENWRREAIKRFEKKIDSFKTEEEIYQYIITDLKKYGYVPMWKQKPGFRMEKIK